MLRRLILAAALMAGLVPAFAQSPTPVPALPDTERRTSYTISGTTCACTVNFALYGDTADYQNWVEVWINGTRVNYNDPVLGWTITSPSGPLSNLARPITDAVLTFNAVQTGTIQIVGARRPRRVSQFNENTGVSARNLNQVITDIIAMLREAWDKINDVTGRVVMAPPGETMNTLPPATTRANFAACFDSGGNLATCVSVPSSTFTAGNGIQFSGSGPTTIKNNIQAGQGVSITGTNPLTIAAGLTATSSIAGATTTYTAAQGGTLVQRSNSGSPMSDLLPGTGTGVLAAGTIITFVNVDTAGILSLKAASGAVIKGSLPSTGYLYVCPGQSASFYSDGSNYWPLSLPGRCRLQASTTLFIATTGSSTNDGLTASTPLPDTNTAYSLAQSVLDLNFKPINFAHATGSTYPCVLLNGPLLGANANPTSGSNVSFTGNAGTPTNVVINTSTCNNGWLMTNGAVGLVNGFSIMNSIGHDFAVDEGAIALIENMAFSETGVHQNHIVATSAGIVYIIGNFSISSNAGCSWIAGQGGQIQTFNLSATITATLTGTPSWNTAFACTQYPAEIIINTAITFTGAATGVRYSVSTNGNINTGGGGANFFPGNSAGVGGGVYQ